MDGPRSPSGLLALDDMRFERRYLARGGTDAPGASRNFVNMLSGRRMRAQKIMNEIGISHNYGYVVADLMGIEPDHAKSRFQFFTAFLAAYIKQILLWHNLTSPC
jgi:hypothetical protein